MSYKMIRVICAHFYTNDHLTFDNTVYTYIHEYVHTYVRYIIAHIYMAMSVLMFTCVVCIRMYACVCNLSTLTSCTLIFSCQIIHTHIRT